MRGIIPLLETETNECPVSLIEPESFELVQIIATGMTIHEMTGATDGGADSSQWDARQYDALLVFTHEERRVEMAIRKAQEKR